jgi:nucleoside 2-deoxyribosyltransferase
MSTNVYLASQYHEKAATQKCADDLKAAGLICTSTWLQERHAPLSKLSALQTGQKIDYAEQDLADVRRANVFVVFSVKEDTPILRGGMVFETGYAFALGKPVIVCGPKQNIFHWLPSIRQVDTWPEVLEILKGEYLG